MPNAKTRTVAMSALIKRINRKLKPDDQRLRVTRGGESVRRDLGDYYIHDGHLNAIVSGHVDPLALARKLGVVQPRGRHEGQRAMKMAEKAALAAVKKIRAVLDDTSNDFKGARAGQRDINRYIRLRRNAAARRC